MQRKPTAYEIASGKHKVSAPAISGTRTKKGPTPRRNGITLLETVSFFVVFVLILFAVWYLYERDALTSDYY